MFDTSSLSNNSNRSGLKAAPVVLVEVMEAFDALVTASNRVNSGQTNDISSASIHENLTMLVVAGVNIAIRLETT